MGIQFRPELISALSGATPRGDAVAIAQARQQAIEARAVQDEAAQQGAGNTFEVREAAAPADRLNEAVNPVQEAATRDAQRQFIPDRQALETAGLRQTSVIAASQAGFARGPSFVTGATADSAAQTSAAQPVQQDDNVRAGAQDAIGEDERARFEPPAGAALRTLAATQQTSAAEVQEIRDAFNESVTRLPQQLQLIDVNPEAVIEPVAFLPAPDPQAGFFRSAAEAQAREQLDQRTSVPEANAQFELLA